VSRIADSGRGVADYLSRRGPGGVLDQVQDFARRRPGAFLATALAAGFVVGRLGKGVVSAGGGSATGKPRTDAYVSDVPPMTTEPLGAEPLGAEPVGAGPLSAEPVYPTATAPAVTTTGFTGSGTPIRSDPDEPATGGAR